MYTNIIEKIDEKICRWYNHVKRMGNDRLPNLLMNWQPYGRNRRVLPNKRWRDNLKEGLERYDQIEIEVENREQYTR